MVSYILPTVDCRLWCMQIKYSDLDCKTQREKKLFKIYLLQPVFVHIPTVDRRLQCMQFKYSLALTCAIIFLPWTASNIFPQLNLPPTRIERALPFEMFFGAKLLLQRATILQ